MVRCLVTGGAGFIGSHICEQLVSKGYFVTVLDDLSTGSLNNFNSIKGKITFVRGSVTDKSLVRDVCSGIDYIFHEAAQVSVQQSIKNPELTYEINLEGTRNVLDAALECGSKQIVFASSSAVYGNTASPLSESSVTAPISPYGDSKLQSEKLISDYSLKYGINGTCLRYFNVYGPRQSASSPYSGVIAKFISCTKKSEPLTVFGNGEQTRDFVYVKDVARANLQCIEKSVAGIMNVGTGKPTSLNVLVRTLEKITGKKLICNYQPSRIGDIEHSCAKTNRVRRLLGFTPEYSFEQGLKETFDWY